MTKFDPVRETEIAKAIKYFLETPGVKKSKAAAKFFVPYRQFKARLNGRPAQNTKGGTNTTLIVAQENGLRSYIDYLIFIGHKANKVHIRLGANSILRQAGSTRRVDNQWARRWFKRNKGWYKNLRAKTLAAERKAAHRQEDLEHYFSEFKSTIKKYGIDPIDIYNMDETGFRIGIIAGRIVITHLTTKAVYLADPDNRESLTAVETIGADGSTIPPMLILKGDVLLEKYFENDLENETLLATSSSGYSNEGLAMKYLIHFHNNTFTKCKGQWRMLIFDGHGSHVSEDFLLYYWEHQIVPF
jgi:hypothetical protein